jgi:hypothetical protein
MLQSCANVHNNAEGRAAVLVRRPTNAARPSATVGERAAKRLQQWHESGAAWVRVP